MKISYNWLQSFFDKKLPRPEKLAEVLTMHSFEVEGIEKKGTDYVFDIDVLPNRTHDCLCHLGVAKEIGAILNLKPQNQKLSFHLETKFLSKLKIEVLEPKLCRRYIGRIIKEVKVGPSPKWLKERLEAIGQKSINNIVDAGNYVMLEMGQPLHAFDLDKVEGGIIVRRAKNGEKIITLDNRNLELDENNLVIADEKSALAIAGIKGGKKTEIDKGTKNIILESANFESVNIRKTSQKFNLQTGASVGFENDISPEVAGWAIERVTDLILEIAGGKVASTKDFYPKKARVVKIGIKSAEVEKLLGIKISEKEIVDILKRLGMEIKKAKDSFIVTPPIERLDLTIKEDLIEEVARIYGYQKIKPEIPQSLLIPPKRNDNYFYSEMIRNIFSNLGFSEVYNYSFAEKGEIEIQNPIAKDKKYLRINLLDGLKKNIKDNKRYFDKVKIFELGKIFPKEGETTSLATAISNGNFYEIKGVVEMLLEKIGLTDFYFEESKKGVAEIKVGNVSLGIIDHNCFEINFEMLVKMANEEMEYRPISIFPAAKRDISLFVPLETKVEEVMNIIENSGGNLLVDTDLFDIYENKERKSFAFHLVFQAKEKTLSEKEINALTKKIMDNLDRHPNWEVRR